MDLITKAIDTYVEGGKLVWASVQSFSLQSFFEDVSPSSANISGILLSLVLGGLLAFIVIARLTKPSAHVPGAEKANLAIGFDAVAVEKEGAPPIPPPTEVVSLRIYPIKSCRGFEVDGTRVRKAGLTLDRNWMFIDCKTRKFLTIRSDPTMTLIDTSLVDEKLNGKDVQMLEISIRGKEDRVTVPAFPSQEWLKENTTLSNVEIWEKETDAYEYSDKINSTFSAFFDKKVSLVYKGPTARMVAINGSKDLYGTATPHNFGDVMSLLVASEASLADLNRRLASQDDPMDELSIERFRPNIIVKGRPDHPWEEDHWKRIRLTTSLPEEKALYKVDLDVVARCARCQVPNVNPDTADKHPKQPWDELMKFRRIDHGGVAKWKPCFGMMCIPKNEGKVSVGAKLEVLETTAKHSYNTAKFEDL
ncbi:Hypothetical protein R9X50_00408900 [Acrodontium crateriforme]|uniref:MOSC domain-containing protein n=1 Tax=Acrodontium crateriforme TaxID=150365 RepID=A0AAQ3R4S8_9PEZI|nr:Hypothetical protein R9X50_00408900 [Acrodontium crateriforme]